MPEMARFRASLGGHNGVDCGFPDLGALCAHQPKGGDPASTWRLRWGRDQGSFREAGGREWQLMAASAQIARVNPWHQRFALWLIAHGETKGWGRKAAQEFGVTQAWISTVYHSDAFQDYYKALRDEHTKAIVHSIADKLNGAAGQALDILQEKLELEGPSLPFDTVLEAVDVLTKRAVPAQKPGDVNVLVAQVSREELEAFRARMRQRREPEAIELQAEDIPSSKPSEAPGA